METRHTIFFDLFYTLVKPEYQSDSNEYDVLGVSRQVWEQYAEEDKLYRRRASGILRDPKSIVEEILVEMGRHVPDVKRREVLRLREERMQQSLLDVDSEILHVLRVLKDRGWGLCVISNADVIDVMHWNESPLSQLFDKIIFSCWVGYLKPQPEIYKIALKEMNADPKECVYVGDGGSDELNGAKQVGLTTVLSTHYLTDENEHEKRKLAMHADHFVRDFKDILSIPHVERLG